MIKVNLLNSVTERQGGAIDAVDRRVGSPGTRLLLMSLAIGFLTFAVIGWDIISTQMAKAAAEQELATQKQIGAELEVVMNEQKDLEAKIKSIDTRIQAIKDLDNHLSWGGTPPDEWRSAPFALPPARVSDTGAHQVRLRATPSPEPDPVEDIIRRM